MTMIFKLLALLSALVVVKAQTTVFQLPKGFNITCSDEAENRCTAPLQCSVLGEADINGYGLNIGQTGQEDGLWYTNGAYSLQFPHDCEVTCEGNCTCADCDDDDVKVLKAGGGDSSGSPATFSLMALLACLAAYCIFVF